MRHFKNRKGFSLMEMLVVLCVMLVIGIFVVTNLTGRRSNADLTATTKEIGTLLRQAQSDSMAQEGGSSWGVYFANATATAPFFALFQGVYSNTSTVYRLPATVAYVTSTLAVGATTSISFTQIVGIASASTSISLYMPKQSASFSSTISIASSGAISY